jgi:hypothetical protein
LIGLAPGADTIKLFFLRFLFFDVKLGYFTINYFSLCNKHANNQKMEKFFVSEEKRFIGLATGLFNLNNN